MATLNTPSPSTTVFLSLSLLLVFLTPQISLSSSSSSIHDLLRSKGLPPGLLPEEVKSYTFQEDGHLEVFLDAPCLTKYENRVLFEQVVTANLTYGSLIGVEGLQQEELFVWLPVKDIIVSDPSSGLILFDIGLAHKQLSLSLSLKIHHTASQKVKKKKKGLNWVDLRSTKF